MALTLDASSPAQATGTTSGLATASFTAPGSALLVAFVTYNNVNTTANDHTVTDSGGLTWTLVARKSPNATSLGGAGQPGGVEIWSATTASSVPRTVSVAFSGGTSRDTELSVKVITDTGGAPTVGAVAAASSASGLPSVSVTTTGANSWVWADSSDWAQKGLGTAGSGQTITDESNVSGQYTGHVWKQNATTASSGTSVTMNLTAVSAQQYNQLAVEILANSGGGGSVTIAGPATNITTAAPAGTVQAAATIAGPATGVATAALAGTVNAGVTIAGPVAALTLTALPGTVQAGVVIAGLKAGVTTAALAGTVQAGVIIAGAKASVTTTALVGTVQAGVTIAGPVAALTLTALPGSVVTGSNVTIAGPTTALALSAPAGTVSAGVVIAGATAGVTFTALAGTVTTGISVAGPTAAVVLSAKAGTVQAAVNIAGPTVGLTFTALAGSVVIGSNVAIAGQTARVTFTALPGGVDTNTAVLPITVTGSTEPLINTVGSSTSAVSVVGSSAPLVTVTS